MWSCACKSSTMRKNWAMTSWEQKPGPSRSAWSFPCSQSLLAGAGEASGSTEPVNKRADCSRRPRCGLTPPPAEFWTRHTVRLQACWLVSIYLWLSCHPLLHLCIFSGGAILTPPCFSASLMRENQLKIKCDTLYINNRFNLNWERRDESSRAGGSCCWWTYSSKDLNVMKRAKLKLWCVALGSFFVR